MALWLHFFGQCLDIIVCWPLCFGWTCVSPSSSVSLAKLAEGLLAQVFRAPRGMLCFVILLLTCEHNVMLGLRGLPSDQSWDFDELCSVLSLTHSHLIITDIFPSWWDFVMVWICRQARMMMMVMMTMIMLMMILVSVTTYPWKCDICCPHTVAHNESRGK